jgi:hypothetical protein
MKIILESVLDPTLYRNHYFFPNLREYFFITSVRVKLGGTGLWSFSPFYKNGCDKSSSRVALWSASVSNALVIMFLSCSSTMLLSTYFFSPLLIILHKTLKA